MSDIRLFLVAADDGAGMDLGATELRLVGGDLAIDDGLATAALISLLTWARIRPGDPVRSGETFGWWADAWLLALPGGRAIGSHLWQYRDRKLDRPTLAQLERDVVACLDWLVEDGAARRVSLVQERRGIETVADRVTIARADGAAPIELRFDDLWKATLA